MKVNGIRHFLSGVIVRTDSERYNTGRSRKGDNLMEYSLEKFRQEKLASAAAVVKAGPSESMPAAGETAVSGQMSPSGEMSRGKLISGAAENEDVLTRIGGAYHRMSRNYRIIADYVTVHYEEAVFMTAAKLGAKVKVSESTVVRFASSLGYAGYPGFQHALEDFMSRRYSNVRRVGAKYGDSSDEEIISAVVGSDIEKLQDVMARTDGKVFRAAVNEITEARTVYVVGLRSCAPLAQLLAFYLGMIRGNVVLLSSTNSSEIFEQMIRISGDDVLIGISFPRYSMRTLKAMQFANDRSAHVIAITDNVHSPMNLYSSVNLFARSDMVSIVDSLTAPLSLINALIVALCVKSPDKVEANLKELEDALDNYQVYKTDEINYVNDGHLGDAPLYDEGSGR
jgi:DNA-binding MurR/RpiR family transcriptional regulator